MALRQLLPLLNSRHVAHDVGDSRFDSPRCLQVKQFSCQTRRPALCVLAWHSSSLAAAIDNSAKRSRSCGSSWARLARSEFTAATRRAPRTDLAVAVLRDESNDLRVGFDAGLVSAIQFVTFGVLVFRREITVADQVA